MLFSGFQVGRWRAHLYYILLKMCKLLHRKLTKEWIFFYWIFFLISDFITDVTSFRFSSFRSSALFCFSWPYSFIFYFIFLFIYYINHPQFRFSIYFLFILLYIYIVCLFLSRSIWMSNKNFCTKYTCLTSEKCIINIYVFTELWY